jgi:hypothetical protein
MFTGYLKGSIFQMETERNDIFKDLFDNARMQSNKMWRTNNLIDNGIKYIFNTGKT